MKALVTAVVLALLVGACGDDAAPLTASDVRVTRPLPGAQTSAAYFTLHNTTSDEIRISRVSSPQFGKVEMHESRVEDGIARMTGLASVSIPAGSSVAFEPGGKHLMLMQPAAELDTVTLEFHAGDAPVLAVTVDVSD